MALYYHKDPYTTVEVHTSNTHARAGNPCTHSKARAAVKHRSVHCTGNAFILPNFCHSIVTRHHSRKQQNQPYLATYTYASSIAATRSKGSCFSVYAWHILWGNPAHSPILLVASQPGQHHLQPPPPTTPRSARWPSRAINRQSVPQAPCAGSGQCYRRCFSSSPTTW